jgi:hypothetical protein
MSTPATISSDRSGSSTSSDRSTSAASALDVLHDDVRHDLSVELLLAGVVHGDDRRVVELRPRTAPRAGTAPET